MNEEIKTNTPTAHFLDNILRITINEDHYEISKANLNKCNNKKRVFIAPEANYEINKLFLNCKVKNQQYFICSNNKGQLYITNDANNFYKITQKIHFFMTKTHTYFYGFIRNVENKDNTFNKVFLKQKHVTDIIRISNKPKLKHFAYFKISHDDILNNPEEYFGIRIGSAFETAIPIEFPRKHSHPNYYCVKKINDKHIILRNAIQEDMLVLSKMYPKREIPEKPHVISQCVKVKINKKHLKIYLHAYLVQILDNVEKITFHITEDIYTEITLNSYQKRLNIFNFLFKNNMKIITFDTQELLEKNIAINNLMYFNLHLKNGDKLSRAFTYINKSTDKSENKRPYLVPYSSLYVNHWIFSINRSPKGNVSLTKRKEKQSESPNLISNCFGVKIQKNYLKFYIQSFLMQTSDNVEKVTLHITEDIYSEVKLKSYQEHLNIFNSFINNTKIVTFEMSELLETSIAINNTMYFNLHLNNGEILQKNFTSITKTIENADNRKRYYIPYNSAYIDDWAFSVRRTSKGTISLIKRKKEEVECTPKFKFYENQSVSRSFYYFGKIANTLKRKKINLYFEKFAAKSEEGVFELCCKAQKSTTSKNLFIIEAKSPDYPKICMNNFVVKKFSLKYYWLIYISDSIISTEAPMHINILRSNNKLLRKSIYNKPNVFLQHGIIYMKNLGHESPFIKNREAEPTYILVSSQKEANIVTTMLQLPKETILNTGIPMYNVLKYNHISEENDNIATIMLTWKQYEEHLEDFSKSTYYKMVLKVYTSLSKYMPSEKIHILAHPKAFDALESTDMGSRIYKGPISEILPKSKLMITDYSSICYNSFYQGSGVIFYQEDIEKYEYETGPLIPTSNEYIGKRAFDIEELEKIFDECIIDSVIQLDKLRTEEFINNYDLINEHHDGKNINRIFDELKKLDII